MEQKHKDEAYARYADYSKEIQDYMQAVIDSLAKEDENFDRSWFIQLDLLAANMNAYLIGKRRFEEEQDEEVPDVVRVRQAFQIMNTSQVQIQAIMKSFGLTKMGRAKISNLNKRGDQNGGFDIVAYTRDLMS